MLALGTGHGAPPAARTIVAVLRPLLAPPVGETPPASLVNRRLFAAAYGCLEAQAERAGMGERRRRLLASAHGRVLEVGGGTGANLAHYPPAVHEVVVLEPDAAMRRRLQRRLGTAPVAVTVQASSLEDAVLAEESFDTVVCTLVLCTVADPPAALERVRRLLSPRGVLLFLEHVQAVSWHRHLQRAMAPAWRRMSGGCHLDRDIPAAIRGSGLVITDIDRFCLPWAGRLVPAVQGAARPRTAPTAAVHAWVAGPAAS